MRTTVGVCLVITCFGAACLLAQPDPFEDVDDGKVLDRWIAVGRDASSYASLRQIAMAFVEKEATQHQIFRLVIGDTIRTVANSVVPPQIRSGNMSEALAKALPGGPVARVFGVGGNAILTYRNGSIFREEILLGHTDPTLISEGGTTYRLLHFHLTKLGTGSRLRPPYALRVYLKSLSSVSVRSTVAMTERITQMTNASLVSISVRKDEWFLNDREYPESLPFLEALDWPKRGKFDLGPSLTCGGGSRGMTCSGSIFVP